MKTEYRVIDSSGFDMGIAMLDAQRFDEGSGYVHLLPQIPTPRLAYVAMTGDAEEQFEKVVLRQVPRRDGVAQHISGPIDRLSREVFVRRTAIVAENKEMRREMVAMVVDLECAAQTKDLKIMRDALYRNARRLRDAASFRAAPPKNLGQSDSG